MTDAMTTPSQAVASLATITRYEFMERRETRAGTTSWEHMRETPDGPFVRYSDVAAMVEREKALRSALQRQHADLTRELERLAALMKAGNFPHVMTIWTHLNTMRHGAAAALPPPQGARMTEVTLEEQIEFIREHRDAQQKHVDDGYIGGENLPRLLKLNAILATLRKVSELERDAEAMRRYYVTAYAHGFRNSPLWHELADETRQLYRDAALSAKAVSDKRKEG